LELRKEYHPSFFETTGEVQGSGSFSEWRRIGEMAGVDAKQTSSATDGELLSSSRLLLISDKLNYTRTDERNAESFDVTVEEQWPTYIASNDYVNFVGIGYRESERYSNNGDMIQSKFESGNILKESRYIGGLDNALIEANVSSNGTAVKALYNKTTEYNIYANYIGILNLNMRDKDIKEISEDYMGIMNVSINMMNRESFNKSESDCNASTNVRPQNPVKTFKEAQNEKIAAINSPIVGNILCGVFTRCRAFCQAGGSH